jgi:hypothetical protein
MKNLTLYSGTLTAGASTGTSKNISVTPLPASVMLPVEINCSTTVPVVTIQGKLTDSAGWSDLSSTVSGTLQLVPRCNFYRVSVTAAAGGETLTVTLGVM